MNIQKFKLIVTFTEPILGSQPQRDVATEFIHSKHPEETVNVPDELDSLEEKLEKQTTAFHHDPDRGGAPILFDYQVKGFIKEAASIFNGAQGVKNTRSKVGNTLFVKPRKIPLDAPGPITFNERPLRAMTMQGPRTALTRSEQLPAGTKFECELHLLRTPKQEITENLIREVLDYGQYQGLGQWRTGGWGRFEYVLTPIGD